MGGPLRILRSLSLGITSNSEEVGIDARLVNVGPRELAAQERKQPSAAPGAALMRRNAKSEERSDLYHHPQVLSHKPFNGSAPPVGIE